MFFIEPSSDLRQFASLIRQLYVALTNEGFTDDEAMTIVLSVIARHAKGEGNGF